MALLLRLPHHIEPAQAATSTIMGKVTEGHRNCVTTWLLLGRMCIVQNITFSITDQLSLSCKVSDLMLLENKDAKRNYHVMTTSTIVPTPNGKCLEKCL